MANFRRLQPQLIASWQLEGEDWIEPQWLLS